MRSNQSRKNIWVSQSHIRSLILRRALGKPVAGQLGVLLLLVLLLIHTAATTAAAATTTRYHYGDEDGLSGNGVLSFQPKAVQQPSEEDNKHFPCTHLSEFQECC